MQEDNITTINDYELLSLAQAHNEDAINIIYKKYQPLIQKICKKQEKNMKKYGLELEDLIQECYITINNAIESFNEIENTSFYTHVAKCLQNRLVSILRTQQKESYKILNEAISLDEETKEENEQTLHNYIQSNNTNPDKIIIEEETYTKFINKITKNLSYLEESILILKLQDFNYKEIADILDKNEKSIDNAMQRIRQKIKKIMAL